MVNILLGCTGSVATIKIPLIVEYLLKRIDDSQIALIVTKNSLHFFDPNELPQKVNIFRDEVEWVSWSKRGDPIVHIDLGKWADIFVIAPLDANTLAKISNGLCDNLLSSTVRAWDIKKPLIFCPAMNTKMYEHPLTEVQINVLLGWGYKMIPVVEKTLVCGDTGLGAMAEVETIINFVQTEVLTRKL